MKHNTDLDGFQKIIQYQFNNTGLLKNALTHSSYANEKKNGNYKDNERLEFLGDAVLELTSSEFIYTGNPDMNEGKMTRLRASIVCEPTLAMCARQIHLQEYIMLVFIMPVQSTFRHAQAACDLTDRHSLVSVSCEQMKRCIQDRFFGVFHSDRPSSGSVITSVMT